MSARAAKLRGGGLVTEAQRAVIRREIRGAAKWALMACRIARRGDSTVARAYALRHLRWAALARREFSR